jgi:hypothetical protein
MKAGKRGHRLSKRQQLEGLEKAIQSERTPERLKDSMRRFAKKLRDEIAAEDHPAHQNCRHSIFQRDVGPR